MNPYFMLRPLGSLFYIGPSSFFDIARILMLCIEWTLLFYSMLTGANFLARFINLLTIKVPPYLNGSTLR